jgi:hypothetical protein
MYHDQSQSLLVKASTTAFQHRSTTAFPGTYDWIFSNAVLGFEAWLLEPRGSYWIQGKPGSGKTTLIKHVLGSTRLPTIFKGMKFVTAVHYFRADSSALARSIGGMLQSLLWQVMKQVHPDAIRTVLEHYRRIRTAERYTWSLPELEISLIEVVTLLPDTAVCLFIDGLDEHQGKDAGLTDHLWKFQKTFPANVRLCASSRPHSGFLTHFEGSKGFRMQDHTFADIKRYVTHRCKDLKEYLPDEIRSLSEKIIIKAQGSFLWTRLVCNDLREDWVQNRTYEELARRLETIPDDLQPFYQRIVDELDEQKVEELNHVISIVNASAVPLTALELCYAMDHARNFRGLQHVRCGNWKAFDKHMRIAAWDDRISTSLPIGWIQGDSVPGLSDGSHLVRGETIVGAKSTDLHDYMGRKGNLTCYT